MRGSPKGCLFFATNTKRQSPQINPPFVFYIFLIIPFQEQSVHAQARNQANNLLHLSLAEELSSFAASNRPQPAGSSAMIVYAVPGFACPDSLYNAYSEIYYSLKEEFNMQRKGKFGHLCCTAALAICIRRP